MNKINNKKRIIFFLPVFSIGGASESITKLSKFLINHNYSIALVSLGKNANKKYFKKIGCDVFELKAHRALFSILSLRKLIKKNLEMNFSQVILISNIHYANIISLIACFKLRNIKIIFTERSSLSELLIQDTIFNFLKKKIIFFIAKYSYKYVDLIITNSKFEKRFIKKKFFIKNVKCIYPGSISKIEVQSFNKKILKYNNQKKIIYVGRLSKEKGIITILKALNKIKNTINFKLYIFGEGVEKKNILDFIKLNNLDKKIIFKGFYKDKKKIFLNSSLFINASWFEGLPNALVQSINYNVFPICSSSYGGNLEVIKYGKLGLSFNTNNYDELSKKIIFYFKKKLRLNNALRIKHLKNFTEEKSNTDYLKTLKNL